MKHLWSHSIIYGAKYSTACFIHGIFVYKGIIFPLN